MNYLIGRLYELLRVPPMVARLERQTIMGKEIEIRTSRRYTIVAVDGLELFFNRESGKYDGWAVQGAASQAEPHLSCHGTPRVTLEPSVDEPASEAS